MNTVSEQIVNGAYRISANAKTLLNNRNVKTGILVFGSTASIYLAYNNFGFVVNVAKDLTSRLINGMAALGTGAVLYKFVAVMHQIGENPRLEFQHFSQYCIDQSQKVIDALANSPLRRIVEGVKTLLNVYIGNENMGSVYVGIGILFLASFMSLAKTLSAHLTFNNINAKSLISMLIYGLVFGCVSPILLYSSLVVTYDFALSLYKIATSNNKWLSFKFILGSCFAVKTANRREVLKLPIDIWDKIITSDPWDAFRLLTQHTPGLTSHSKDMLYLAGYPVGMFFNERSETNYHGNYSVTTTTYAFKYPSLLVLVQNKQPLVDVLYHLGKFPDLYKGDDRLSDHVLHKILSLADPGPKLANLCSNLHLWKGPNKLTEDLLLNVVGL